MEFGLDSTDASKSCDLICERRVDCIVLIARFLPRTFKPMNMQTFLPNKVNLEARVEFFGISSWWRNLSNSPEAKRVKLKILFTIRQKL